jgi:hypothetical protein
MATVDGMICRNWDFQSPGYVLLLLEDQEILVCDIRSTPAIKTERVSSGEYGGLFLAVFGSIVRNTPCSLSYSAVVNGNA